MNRKINELAVKAGVTFDWDPGTSGPEVYFDRQEDFEKFAELIVAECVKVAMRSVSDDEPKEAWYLIQEHFGVEE